MGRPNRYNNDLLSRMRKWRYTPVAISLSLIIAACSTTPISIRTATPVPVERIYAPSLVAKSDSPTTKARVSFSRDSAFYRFGCSNDVYVNNRKVFAIHQNEYIQLSLDPGSYYFRLGTGGGLCPSITIAHNVSLKSGAREIYRIVLPTNGAWRMARAN